MRFCFGRGGKRWQARWTHGPLHFLFTGRGYACRVSCGSRYTPLRAWSKRTRYSSHHFRRCRSRRQGSRSGGCNFRCFCRRGRKCSSLLTSRVLNGSHCLVNGSNWRQSSRCEGSRCARDCGAPHVPHCSSGAKNSRPGRCGRFYWSGASFGLPPT